MKLSEILKVGNKITVFKKCGGNWRLTILEIDDENQCALLRQADQRPTMGPCWYDIKVGKRGIPYAV